MIFSIIFFLSFLILFIISEPIIPESSFQLIESHIPHFFSLNNDTHETYFKFKNSDSEKDLVLNLVTGKGYSVDCYVYTSPDEIQKKDKEYINYLFNFTMDQKQIYFSKKESKTYYFVCVDYKLFYYDDYLTIFNEADAVKLDDNIPYTINKFYSTNSYTFEFKGNKNEKINILLNSEKEEFNQTITIIIDDQEIEKINENKINKTYNSDFSKESSYKIQILSNETTYSNNLETIIIYKIKRDVIFINESSNFEKNYIYGDVFNFYSNVDDFNLNEEGIISFKYGSYSAQKKMLKYIYGKIINLDSDSDDNLLKNMPSKKEDSEFEIEKWENLDTLYQMFFKKKKEKEEGKKSYLLIQIKLDDNATYFQSENFTISLSQRANKITFLNNETIHKKELIHLKNYVPLIYYIYIPKENQFSYAFYVNNDIAKIYNGTLLNDLTINNKSIKKQLYAVSKGTNNIDVYTVQIFSYEQDIEIRIETIESEIFYLRDFYRPVKSFSRELMNCKDSFYYIGDYDLTTDVKHLYIEELFGKYNLYYKNEILKDDESILTRGNEKYLLNTTTPLLNSNIDIIEAKCKYPGHFIIHLLSDSIPLSLTNNGRILYYITKGIQNHFNIPKIENMNFEISSPLGVEISLNLYDKNIMLNESNKIYRLTNITEEEYEMTFIGKDNTIIDIKIGYDNLFTKITKKDKSTESNHLIIELEKNLTYKEIGISLSNISKSYSYYLMKGNSGFASEPNLSVSFDIIKKNDLKLNLTNPYDKYPLMETEEKDIFYIAFVADTENSIDINIDYLEKENYSNIPEKVNTILSPTNKKMGLNLNTDESLYLNIFSTICNYDFVKKISLSYYDSEILEFNLNKKNVKYLSINNPMIPLQIETQYENNISNDSYIGTEIIYYYGDTTNLDSLNDLSLEINNSSKTITWKAIEGYNVSYELYYFDIESNYSNYLENDCFLKSFKGDNKTNRKNLKDDSKNGFYETDKSEFTFEKQGKYKINVVAIINDKIQYRIVYKSQNYDSDLENGSYLWFYITLPLVLIFVIVLIYLLLRGKMRQPRVSGTNEKLIDEHEAEDENV